MADLPEPLQQAYRDFRAALALADEMSEGTYYAAFWSTVAHLQSRVDNIVEHFRPGIEVDGALRLPDRQANPPTEEEP